MKGPATVAALASDASPERSAMRATRLFLPCCAAVLASCDAATTQPDATRQAATSSQNLLLGSGWTRVSLPFTPYGINDATVVVGESSGVAVRWDGSALA